MENLYGSQRYMRCKDCSRLSGRPFKRSHLVALRPTKISALDPPSEVARGTIAESYEVAAVVPPSRKLTPQGRGVDLFCNEIGTGTGASRLS